MNDLEAYLEAPSIVIPREGYETLSQNKWGSQVLPLYDNRYELSMADIILVGCYDSVTSADEEGNITTHPNCADTVREIFYNMFCWHTGLTIGDIGNIKQGATPTDTKAALLIVLREIEKAGKVALIIGAGHDLTLQQYEVFKADKRYITAAVVDMLMDIHNSETVNENSFLNELLTNAPNYLSHYSHLAFQSYYSPPHIVETLDKLRFDFYRLGMIKADILDVEPVLRSSNIVSFDICSIRQSDAPAVSHASPNGLTGEEACVLARYAGMSSALSSFGIYGFLPQQDRQNLTAQLIGQMIWYFIDGYTIRQKEGDINREDDVLKYHVLIMDTDVEFVKSAHTNRWWMKMSDNKFIPCSYNDFLEISNNKIPERWLRYHERLI
ncbi:MAG: arginase [Chitinophagia bacterium]|nr:arginase [Chitinophagia bacterium]